MRWKKNTKKVKMMNKGYVTLGILVAVLVSTFLFSSCYQRIDPGDAGILVNYAAGTQQGKPVITALPPGQYVFIAPFSGQTLVQYPTAQQKLVLASNSNEGEIPGNSTIACVMAGGGTIHFGINLNWQVNKEHPEILYQLNPNVQLSSTPNNDINTVVVMKILQGDLLDLCSKYTWKQIIGDGSTPVMVAQMKQELFVALTHDMAKEGIVVDSVELSERIPDDNIRAVLDANNKAQQSAYLQQEAQNQANAEIVKAKVDAQSIDIINGELAKSPAYVQYLIANKWDGHLPSALSTTGSPVLSPFGK